MTQKRTVRFEIMLPMEFPDDMNDWEINFLLNESSWCMSNVIEILQAYDEEHGCICNICEGRVVPLSGLPGGREHKECKEHS